MIICLIAVATVFWLLNRSKRYMPAEVRSSNGSHYSLIVTGDMEPTKLDENASFEYRDKKNELYAMVVDESKAKIISFDLDYDLETYMKIASRRLDSAGMYVNKPLMINGNRALQTDIKKKVKGETIFYRLTVLETPKYFYQLLVWTIESRLAGNKADMETIITSFREVDEAKVKPDTTRKK